MQNRMLILDLYRALAVVLMLIFHFAYDLHISHTKTVCFLLSPACA